MNVNLGGLAKAAAKGISAHSSEILTGVGLILGGKALWTVGKTAPKASKLIEEEEQKQGRSLTFKEKAVLTKKLWVSPALYSVASVTCIVGGCAIGVKNNRALAAALTMSEAASATYQEKVKEVIGDKKEQKIRDEIAEQQVSKKPPAEVVYISGEGPELFKETLSNQYFRSDSETVGRRMNDFNYDLINGKMAASKNDWLQGYLDIDPTADGEVLGWNTDKRMDFHIHPMVGPDGKEVVHVIVHDQLPFSGYDNLH